MLHLVTFSFLRSSPSARSRRFFTPRMSATPPYDAPTLPARASELASDLFAVPSKHGVTQHFRSGPFQTPRFLRGKFPSRARVLRPCSAPVFCARVLRPCSSAVYRYLRTTRLPLITHPFQPGFGFRLELIPVCPKMVEKGREHLPATGTTR